MLPQRTLLRRALRWSQERRPPISFSRVRRLCAGFTYLFAVPVHVSTATAGLYSWTPPPAFVKVSDVKDPATWMPFHLGRATDQVWGPARHGWRDNNPDPGRLRLMRHLRAAYMAMRRLKCGYLTYVGLWFESRRMSQVF